MTATGQASAPPPWFRLDASKWRGMTAGLTAAERGILIDLLVLIHQRGEPIPNEPARLARACGTTKAAFERAMTTLMEDGRIVVSEGKFWSDYIETELNNCEKRSQAAKENASKRWGKTQRNQIPDDATAMLYGDSKIIEGASTKPPTSADYLNQSDSDARRGASGLLKIGDEVVIGDFGTCVVEDFGRRKSVTFIRTHRVSHTHIRVIVPVKKDGDLSIVDAGFEDEFLTTKIRWGCDLGCSMPDRPGEKVDAA